MVTNAAGEPESLVKIKEATVRAALRECGISLVGNAMTLDERRAELCELLRAAYGRPGEYWDGWIVAYFEDTVVFANPEPGKYDSSLYMQTYAVASDGEVSLVGAATPVERRVEYVANGVAYAADPANRCVPREGNDMSGKAETKTFDKKAHVDSLIGNGWVEDHRATLMAMSDAVLQNIEPKPKDPPPTPHPIPSAPTPTHLPAGRVLNAAESATFDEMQAAWKKQKDALVANIAKNPNNQFPKDWLEQCPLAVLENMAKLANPPANADGSPLVVNGYNGLPPLFLANAGAPAYQPSGPPTDFLGKPGDAVSVPAK